ncbi:hypothetical protein G6F62_010869 [Rhizopus arrhizus]|nr:hypothetical protein G6F23_011350 [Rhizopus arrhizus]KAG0753948.1 hypothetical protein G6F24_012703 [Rhizopus arrhizus]KAG0777268.1 hypothetical protein G6F22_011987 [Rhizopus arrhizus]KAG0779963.1 hypothetical protein G6F21_012355 [Rhizopus arrhizus]KAG0810174.1 hypothetical protein G6F20_008180 [Rhizopus arrhizus]
MQLKALSLTTLGLLFLANLGVQADETDLISGEPLSESYLSAFDSNEDEPVDFELSEEIAHPFIKRANDCSKYETVSGIDSCTSIAKKHGISLDTFYDLNPHLNRACTNLLSGKKYCVSKDNHSQLMKRGKKSHKRASKQSRKKIQSQSAFTYYWIAQPNDYKSGKKVSVKTCSGKTIASVSEDYADALVMEGTGVIGSKIVNLGDCSCSNYKCFETVNRKSDPFGLTSYDSPLRPFITVASNDIKKGTKIYVPQIAGWKIPGSNKKHNGCLLVDDKSWSFKGHHIDFYVYSKKNYGTMDSAHKITKVDIYEGGNCKLLNYMS